MLKDIWGWTLVFAHPVLILLGAISFGTIGAWGAIGLIAILWWAKIKWLPNVDFMPLKSADDRDWPKPILWVGSMAGSALVILLFMGMIMPLGRCSGGHSSQYEPSRR